MKHLKAPAPKHDPISGRYIGPETLTITLKKPIKVDGANPVTSITVTEPTSGQLSQSLDVERAKNEIEGNMLLISLCAGIDPGQARMLGKRDFEEARDFALGFFDQPPTYSVISETA